MQLLLQHGADAKLASRALFEAVEMEKVDEFRLLVNNGANLFFYNGSRSLLQAAYAHNVKGLGPSYWNKESRLNNGRKLDHLDRFINAERRSYREGLCRF
jgi:fructose 1,6-bisphosphatase